jgi:hypothetical protein
MAFPITFPMAHNNNRLELWCPQEIVVAASQPQEARLHWDESLQTQVTWTDSSVEEERSARIIHPFPETSSSRRRRNGDADDDTVTTAPRPRVPLRDISLEWRNRSNCQTS